MDIDDITRGRSTFLSKMNSKSISVVSNTSSILYHLKMEINNDLPDKITVKPIDSSQLLYQDGIEGRSNPISEAANPGPTRKSQYVQHDILVFNKVSKF